MGQPVGRRGDIGLTRAYPLDHDRGDRMDRPAPQHQGTDGFDAVVAPLLCDRAWRNRVRRVRAGHLVGRAVRSAWSGLGDVGCWFCGVPPQRTVRRPLPR